MRDELVVFAYESTNYSAVNMAFQAAWLACRVVDEPTARAALEQGVSLGLYDRPGESGQPSEQKTPFFDFTYAACASGQSFAKAPVLPVDNAAVARGLQTLTAFSDAPYWDEARINCPGVECTDAEPYLDGEDKVCTALDGSTLDLLGCVGWKGDLVSKQPIPMAIRGPSNFHWRSNPYTPNLGGSGDQALPAVDFRAAYWMGRWARR